MQVSLKVKSLFQENEQGKLYVVTSEQIRNEADVFNPFTGTFEVVSRPFNGLFISKSEIQIGAEVTLNQDEIQITERPSKSDPSKSVFYLRSTVTG